MPNELFLTIIAAAELVLVMAGGVTGYVIKGINDRLKTLENEHKEISSIYARRDDVRDQFNLIIESLRRIEDRLIAK